MVSEGINSKFGIWDDEDSTIPAGVGRLRWWLEQKIWNFEAVGPNLGLRYSQGTCLLAGIDPEESWVCDDRSYKWDLLAGTLQYYGYSKFPSGVDARDMDNRLLRDLETFDALGLDGLKSPKEAIKTALEKNLDIPWLGFAEQSGLTESGLDDHRDKSDGPRRDSKPGMAGATAKWKNDPKKTLRKTHGKQAFQKLHADNFETCKTKGGVVTQAEIARQILSDLEPHTKTDAELPAVRTVEADVKNWICEYEIDLTSYSS